MEKSMGFNVTVVHTESSVGWGGQELRIINECEGLLERGYRQMQEIEACR
jgi:hypothetical protein